MFIGQSDAEKRRQEEREGKAKKRVGVVRTFQCQNMWVSCGERLCFEHVGQRCYKRNMKYIVGVDIGGTFTDCVVVDEEGRVAIGKSLSTPADFSVGALI